MYHQVKWTHVQCGMAANWTVFPYTYQMVIYEFLNVYVANGARYANMTFGQAEFAIMAMLQQSPSSKQIANMQIKCRFNCKYGSYYNDLFDITKIDNFVMWCNTNSLVDQFDLSIIKSTTIVDATLNDIKW